MLKPIGPVLAQVARGAFIEGDTHMETWAAEMDSLENSSDRAWNRFVDEIERLAGREIDGDDGDGLCIDYAHRAWRDGASVTEFMADPYSWS